MLHVFRRGAWLRATVGGLALVGACSPDSPTMPSSSQPSLRAAVVPTTDWQPEIGKVKLCNFWEKGDYAISSTGDNLLGTSVSLASEECVVVLEATDASPVTVTITALPTFGTHPFRINVFGNPIDGEQELLGVATASTTINDATGAAMWFKLERLVVPPPPPPGGGEGCTPGYWKQAQHFDSWSAPYTTGTSFESVFGVNAFPDMSLLSVLGLADGGLNSLGRHTVAALLNSASGEVDYGYDTAEVIAAFQAAYASGEYEAQKLLFEAQNESVCSLD